MNLQSGIAIYTERILVSKIQMLLLLSTVRFQKYQLKSFPPALKDHTETELMTSIQN